jgi:hypothetical protein
VIAVTLTPPEMSMAAQVGCARHIEALRLSLKDKHGAQEHDGWQLHIEGACGELALAKCLGVHWEGTVNTFKRGGDVGTMQVRTRSKHDYELIVRKDDDTKAMYWLVTGTCPDYRIHGFIRGYDAQRAEWWFRHGGREGAWFVPQNQLKPVEDWQCSRKDSPR